jgi:hypothetical protein
VVGRTSGINFVSLVLAYSDLVTVLAQVHSCSMFDLTLCVIPIVRGGLGLKLYQLFVRPSTKT